MENSNKPRFTLHVFVCCNERTDGRKSCGQAHGEMLVASFKERCSTLGLKGQIRVNKAGCLDACAYGPILVVYPESVWYGNVKAGDVDDICREHLIHGRLVERLLINFRMLGPAWLAQLEQHSTKPDVEPGDSSDG